MTHSRNKSILYRSWNWFIVSKQYIFHQPLSFTFHMHVNIYPHSYHRTWWQIWRLHKMTSFWDIGGNIWMQIQMQLGPSSATNPGAQGSFIELAKAALKLHGAWSKACSRVLIWLAVMGHSAWLAKGILPLLMSLDFITEKLKKAPSESNQGCRLASKAVEQG